MMMASIVTATIISMSVNPERANRRRLYGDAACLRRDMRATWASTRARSRGGRHPSGRGSGADVIEITEEEIGRKSLSRHNRHIFLHPSVGRPPTIWQGLPLPGADAARYLSGPARAGPDSRVPSGGGRMRIRRLGVIGAGTMGHSIAALAASAGIEVD
ncbi:MAG: hypothetical protein KGO03_04990, partial [Gemmatimonadota bacterium]|nr:hypothetical protein [Gemmatimonadota bacterium]